MEGNLYSNIKHAKIGTRVKCIQGKSPLDKWWNLENNKIYTIKDIKIFEYDNDSNISLNESAYRIYYDTRRFNIVDNILIEED